MTTREYRLILATMRAMSPGWIDPEHMNAVAAEIEKERPDFDRLRFLEVVSNP